MRVLLAGTSGFCGGVKRAMRIALSAAARGGLAADGPLVHNRQALELLSLRGVGSLSDPASGADRVLIRAHGVSPEKRRNWLAGGRQLVDATCVHVLENQRLAREAAAAGLAVALAADPGHPETLAVAGAAGSRCRVISSPGEAAALDDGFGAGGLLLLAQTTFGVGKFREMSDIVRRRFPNCRVEESICGATRQRQEEAERLARAADILVVVGDRHSANANRLAEAGRAAGRPTLLVETAGELRAGDFAGLGTAAVTAGASTPGWLTQEVVNRLRRLGRPCPGDYLFRLAHFLVESRLSTTLAAAGLAMAAEHLLLNALSPALILSGACFVFFAHVLNRRLPEHPEAVRLSALDSYYRARRSRMLAAAWLAAGLGLILSAWEGGGTFALFLAAGSAAGLYALPAGRLPRAMAGLRRLAGLRHWVMPAGWALILAGPPAWKAGLPLPGAATLLYVFLLRFGGFMARDLHDVASDRLLGIDTLSSRLGAEPSRRLAAAGLILAALIPAGAAGLAVGRSALQPAWLLPAALLTAAPGFGLILLELLRLRRLASAVILQAGVDGMCLLAGLPVLLARLAWA